MAAVRPTASAIGGVPGSNRQGRSFQVAWSTQTSLIISLPPRAGSSASSRARRPYSTPSPVGPSILWAEKA